MTRVAAIDCGTNSIRLLVSDIDAGSKVDLERDMRIVRLGQGVDRTGRLADGAIERTLAATSDYAGRIAEFGVERIAFCATSAARDASNGAQFSEAVEQIIGVRPQIITGAAEARLSFLGAARDLPAVPTLVIDIGGGSTEFVVGNGDDLLFSRSLDVGSVRLTERFLAGDPPGADEVAACGAFLDAPVAAVVGDLPSFESVVGVAGTITTVAAHVLKLTEYRSDAIHRSRLAAADVHRACAELLAMSVTQRRELPFMHPGRADVIGAGALILDHVLTRLGASDLIVSEHDILDGIAWDAAS